MKKTTLNQKPDGTITFDLTLSAKSIAVEYQKVLAEMAKTAEVKGFRKGKAPLAMVEAQSDKSRLYSHVLDHLLSPAYSEVVKEHKLTPVIEPQVTPKSMDLPAQAGEGKDWVMAVEVATIPSFTLGDYTKFIPKALKKHEAQHKLPPEAKPEEVREHRLHVIFDALLDNVKLDVAPLLIEAETKSALSRLVTQLTSLKLSVEDYARSVKKTTGELTAEYKKSAQANLKLEFILQAIAKDQKFEGEEIRRQTLDFLSVL